MSETSQTAVVYVYNPGPVSVTDGLGDDLAVIYLGRPDASPVMIYGSLVELQRLATKLMSELDRVHREREEQAQ